MSVGGYKNILENINHYVEPTHKQGTIAIASGNAARTSATASTEERLKVAADDKIYLLEPNKHSLVSLLTNVGKTFSNGSWKGAGMLKKSVGNPE